MVSAGTVGGRSQYAGTRRKAQDNVGWGILRYFRKLIFIARTEKNIFTEGARGAVGKQAVFKRINGKTVLAKYPDMSNVQYNNVQKEYQSMFGKAVALARSVMNDPERRNEYEKKIRDNKNTRDTSVYSYVIQEFMRANSRKVPEHQVKKLLTRYIERYKLSELQVVAVRHLISQGILSNASYQELNKVSKPTATRHLRELVKLGVIVGEGRGAGAKYRLAETPGLDQDGDENEED